MRCWLSNSGTHEMYNSTQRNSAFRARIANSSTRIYASGWSPDQGDPIQIRAGMWRQYEALKQQKKEIECQLTKLDAEYRDPERKRLGADIIAEKRRLTSVLANVIREKGHLAITLRDIGRLTFEQAFHRVASAMLPKDVMLSIVEETRQLWRKEGHDKFMPEPNMKRKIKSNRKKRGFDGYS